jgi:hypothetical protein
MALTIPAANWIVDVVRMDPQCLRQIESVLSHVLPDDWGIAGGLRNLGFMAQFKTPKDADPYICTGIADVTAAAIEKALATGSGNTGIQSAGTVGRHPPTFKLGNHEFLEVDHAATLILMQDKSNYVFDWHATLNVADPKMYPSKLDFQKARHGILFVDFGGWH